eukprot:CAMPEP_0172557528 /NCGR_PEP_ID=MMETSP1067-20121228/73752_1 /TAXON_ID=265564 ORGANISM="Thalassiosira punctigera, Strain Tpunct2005C2" /NCGR_SAMPLE_ID=MMETSP1067 /ASSEMBLY_ACC=CAM_ASM_000444 /LENGTH=1101 /DNA_ID=CAMNT_0013346633 /DNA_START=230 /DNA_END=3536 /DNA_ORIENTATION=-
MRIVSPCPPLAKIPSDGSREDDNAHGGVLLKQRSSSLLLLDSSSAHQQGCILNEGLIPSAPSSFSIKTEDGNQGCREEERRQDSDREDKNSSSVAKEVDVRVEGTERQDYNELPRLKRVTSIASQASGSSRASRSSRGSKSSATRIQVTEKQEAEKHVAEKWVAEEHMSAKQVKKEDYSDDVSLASKSSKTSRGSKSSIGSKSKKMVKKVKEFNRVISSSSIAKAASSKKNEIAKESDDLPALIAVGTTPTAVRSGNDKTKASLPPLAPKKDPTKQKQKQNRKLKQTQKKMVRKEERTIETDAAETTAVAKTSSTITSPPPNDKDHSWTGLIVGLRLPPGVDSDFDSKCKPTARRVDPSEFLPMGGEEAEHGPRRKEMQRGANGWKKSTHGADLPLIDRLLHVHSTEGVALDIYLTNQNDPSGEPIKIHMVRDPNEDIPKTLQRLQLSVQKKVGGKKQKKKKKKGKDTQSGGGGKQGDEAVLWRKKPQVDFIPAVEPTLLEDNKLEVEDAPTLWDGFYDAFMPINVCNPWSEIQSGGGPEEQQPATRGIEHDLELHETVSSYVNDSILMEGYDRVEYTQSLTIDEVLHQTATMADDLGRYALSVPIVTSNKDSSATSWIPLELNSCPPTITSVSTFGSFKESHLFERTPIVVEVGVLYATRARIAWFTDGERVCADSPCYTPTAADVDKVLTVVITPHRPDHDGMGCEEAYQFQRRVEALPDLPNVIPLREEFLNRPPRQHVSGGGEDPTLRVVTYNILADQNASRDVDKDDDADRMYSHCKNKHIVKWRRHPLIIHEILEYCPDVIALQEVDTDVFEGLLKPVLTAKGYEGYYSQKGVDPASGVREGCAIFWSLEVFESVRPADMRTHTFRDMIQQFSCEERMHKKQWKSLGDMADLVERHNPLKHVLHNKLGHVMQTVVLTQRTSGEKVVIGNSHLFYHPMASHIRCLKILVACRQLEIEHKENQHCPIVFCGDFNSHPNSGVMKLLLNRYLNSKNGRTWKHLCTYEWEEGTGGEIDEDVEAIDLELPASMPSLASAYPDPPEFTHFIEAFVCTLDYILVTNNFELEKSGATPPREDVEKYIAMPNECMPSDHVALFVI